MTIVGTAGWTIPKLGKHYFSDTGSQLFRYSRVFKGVEINSSFHKFHKGATYDKWYRETPEDFKFSVKLNKYFTHGCDLKPSMKDLKNELAAIKHLEEKWRVLLLQFPGSQSFNAKKMERFYKIIRVSFSGTIALEPRHLSWVSPEAIHLMKEYKISKVRADPERCQSKSYSYGRDHYFRLHGSPDLYRSSYSDDFLYSLYQQVSGSKKESWVIFDNTMFGYATLNALALMDLRA